eukprot:1363244-Amorphochlora_amoeboformis.AAC.2
MAATLARTLLLLDPLLPRGRVGQISSIGSRGRFMDGVAHHSPLRSTAGWARVRRFVTVLVWRALIVV